jgi:ABC-type uncharacterized transport system substrate-binding protein
MDRMSSKTYRVVKSLIFILACWSGSVYSAEIYLLPSDNSKAYRQFIRHIQAQVQTPGLHYQVLNPDADLQHSVEPSDPNNLLVTIGTKALYKTLENLPDIPILAVLITRGAFKEFIRRHPDASERVSQGTLGGLYLEQPASRYLYLAAALSPKARRIGAVTGPLSSELLTELRPLTQQFGLEFNHELISGQDNPTRPIDRVMSNSDVYLALPDSSLFNRGTAKWVLLSGLKRRVPIIGFSSRYAEAGAVAAIYTTPEDAATETAQCINLRALNKEDYRLPPPAYPNSYTLTLNHKVSKKLGLPPPDETELRNIISAMEKQQ